jgi:hypothetical protein
VLPCLALYFVLRILGKIGALPPLVTPSEVSLSQLPWSFFFFCATLNRQQKNINHRSNDFVARSLWSNKAKLFSFTLETARKALMLALMSDELFVTDLQSSLANAQENISAKIGLVLSFSLILVWGARVPVVSVESSPCFLHFLTRF